MRDLTYPSYEVVSRRLINRGLSLRPINALICNLASRLHVLPLLFILCLVAGGDWYHVTAKDVWWKAL
jgi:hypothetical protein